MRSPLIALCLLPAILAPAAPPARDEASTEDLIAELSGVKTEGVGFDSVAWASGFVALDETPGFRGGILGTAKPVTPPALRELVRRGCAALPALIAHLSDPRPTGIVVGRGFMGRSFSTEYAPRDALHIPVGVRAIFDLPNPAEDESFETYTIKVGDLCFVAIGQIVNRNLNAVRYQPSLCLVVNSPVERPALAAAVAADWKGLSPPELIASLRRDALYSPSPDRPPAALKRLLFYDPPVGRTLLLQFLDRPLINFSLTSDFIYEMLLPAASERQVERLMATFTRENGETGRLGALHLLAILATKPAKQLFTPREKTQHSLGQKWLAHLFPKADPTHLSNLDGASANEQAELVASLPAEPFEGMDAALLRIIARVAPLEQTDPEETYAQYHLVETCAKRVQADAAHHPNLRAMLARTIAAFQRERHEPPDTPASKKIANELGALRKNLSP